MLNAMPPDLESMRTLAGLIAERNRIDAQIAAHIGRPAERGHLGEYIASRILGVQLESSASSRAIDGRFTERCPTRWQHLIGRTVNIKWYGKQESILDLCTYAEIPDYYLVLAGERGSATSSRGGSRPLVIEAVFLFDAALLHSACQSRGVKLGLATSVLSLHWNAARVWPTSTNPAMALDDATMSMLALFGSKPTARASLIPSPSDPPHE